MIGLARMAQPRIIATEDLLAALRPAGQRAEFAGRVLNLSAGGTLIAGSGFEGGESLGVDSRAPTFDLPAKVRWCTARADQWACAWSSCEYDLAVRGSRRWRTRLTRRQRSTPRRAGGSSTASRSPTDTSPRPHRLMASVFQRGAPSLARTC
jgi:hypothetical protein